MVGKSEVGVRYKVRRMLKIGEFLESAGTAWRLIGGHQAPYQRGEIKCVGGVG